MATLRTLPSISTSFNPSRPPLSRRMNPLQTLTFFPRLNHAKLLSPSRAASSKSSERIRGAQPREEEQLGLTTSVESFVSEYARELALGGLVFALVCLPDEHALALGPGGPLMEEFWDNVRRYGFYFFTVVSGGLYSLAKPVLDLMKDPSTQILVAVVVIGTFYLMYLTVSTMLGLNDFVYQYAQ